MRNIRRIRFMSGIVLLTVILAPAMARPLMSDGAPPPAMPFGMPFSQKPCYAQFLNASYILLGDSQGLWMIEIETGNIEKHTLETETITAMMSNPHADGQVLVATASGSVYFAMLKDSNLVLERISVLSESPMLSIKTFLFHEKNPDMFLAADDTSIAICTYNESNVSVRQTASLDSDSDLIVFAFPDSLHSDWFLISATGEGRYRGNWSTGEIVSVPEQIIEHGFISKTDGKSYFARGPNQEFLNISFMRSRPTFIKRHPTESLKFYAAAIGVSPLLIELGKSNHYDIRYLSPANSVTYSIDIDRHNPDRIIFTNSSNVLMSSDEGKTWRVLGGGRTRM